MPLPPITSATPLELPLTAAYLSSLGAAPLFIGTLWKLRLQVRDEDDVAKSLTGALVVMVLVKGAGLVTRRTGTTSAGAPAPQIVIDADQGAETGDTGKGWFEVRFDAVASDIAFLTTVQGMAGRHEVAIRFVDTITQVVFVAGNVDILPPHNTFPLT